MLLASAGISWFKYVPEFNNNRTYDQSERLSLEIRRVSNRENLTQKDGEEDLEKWRDEFLKTYKGEYAEDIKEFDRVILLFLRRWVSCTRNFTNFELREGYCSNDPVEIFMELPLSAEAIQGEEENLTMEILRAIKTATSIQGDELKKFVAASDGNTEATLSTETGREKDNQIVSNASDGSSSENADGAAHANTSAEKIEV